LSESIEEVTDGVTITVDDDFGTMIQGDLLLNKGFERNNGKYKDFDINSLIGDVDVDLSLNEGKILQKIIMQSSNTPDT
jgi:hypothetical protein